MRSSRFRADPESHAKVMSTAQLLRRLGALLCAYGLLSCTDGSAHATRQASDGDYTTLEGAEDACDRGEPSGCVWAGTAYQFGAYGATLNPAKASALYRTACEANDGQGCHNLGDLVFRGDGVEQSTTEALSLFRESCELKFAGGCLYAGRILASERDDETSQVDALQLFDKACELGDGEACLDAGAVYGTEGNPGFDLEKSLARYARARKLYRAQCDAGDGVGCVSLGLIYQNGMGVEIDMGQAREMFDRACRQSFPTACQFLESLPEASTPESRE